MTLATMGSLRGLLYVYPRRPDTLSILCSEVCLRRVYWAVAGASAAAFLAVPIVWFYLNHTTCRAVYAIGVRSRGRAACGHRRPSASSWPLYGVSGFLAALAGVLLASRLVLPPSVGVGYELDAIAAVVIGGGIRGGGGGTVAGVVGGVLALAMVDNVLNLFDVDPLPAGLEGLDHLVAFGKTKKARRLNGVAVAERHHRAGGAWNMDENRQAAAGGILAAVAATP